MDILVSIVYLTKNGGYLLEKSLEAVFSQIVDFKYEVIVVDSGSTDSTLDVLGRYPVRVHQINPEEFNFGLTRDYGFSLAKGEIVIALSQDAVPVGTDWLHQMVLPFHDESIAVVQGKDLLPRDRELFYWDSVGLFYYTRESKKWMKAHHGIGVSFVSCAIRRDVWDANRLGRIEMSEDKVFQKKITGKGHKIYYQKKALDYHSHMYDVGSLARRCENEGLGWRLAGRNYSMGDMVIDLLNPMIYGVLLFGLLTFRIGRWAEVLFPFIRPVFVYKGNHFTRSYVT